MKGASALTWIGYAVESKREHGSVQIYTEAATAPLRVDQSGASLDHLIGPRKECGGQSDPERFCRFEIYQELVARRCLCDPRD